VVEEEQRVWENYWAILTQYFYYLSPIFFIYTHFISNEGLKIVDNNELELLKIIGF